MIELIKNNYEYMRGASNRKVAVGLVILSTILVIVQYIVIYKCADEMIEIESKKFSKRFCTSFSKKMDEEYEED